MFVILYFPGNNSYVQLNQETTRVLSEKFDIPSKLDSLLLFHEDHSRPVARLSMADLPYSTLKDIIDANKYLQLPRLSSQVGLSHLFVLGGDYVRSFVTHTK